MFLKSLHLSWKASAGQVDVSAATSVHLKTA